MSLLVVSSLEYDMKHKTVFWNIWILKQVKAFLWHEAEIQAVKTFGRQDKPWITITIVYDPKGMVFHFKFLKRSNLGCMVLKIEYVYYIG